MRPDSTVLRRLAFATFDHGGQKPYRPNGHGWKWLHYSSITYAGFVIYGRKCMQQQIHVRVVATIKNWDSNRKQDASPTRPRIRHRKMGNKQHPFPLRESCPLPLFVPHESAKSVAAFVPLCVRFWFSQECLVHSGNCELEQHLPNAMWWDCQTTATLRRN